MFDAGATAVVDVTKFPMEDHSYATENASIKLTEYQPNYLKYEYEAGAEGLVVFSEIYYADGWQAYLDGQPVDHFRADYILRAMQVPAGKHIIEFKFEPKAYTLGTTISLISSVLLLLVIVGAIAYAVKKKPTEVPIVEKV